MNAASAPLGAALRRVAGEWRRWRVVALLSSTGAVALTCVALAAWLLRLGVASPEVVLALWLVVPVVLFAGVAVASVAVVRLGPPAIGAALESAGAWRHGALTTVLDAEAPGTSPALHQRAVADRAAEVVSRGGEALTPAATAQRGVSGRALFAGGAALVVLLAAQPTTAAMARLWSPREAWSAITTPIRLVATTPTVDRGQPAQLEVIAPGWRNAVLALRAPGESWRYQEVPLDARGTARITTAPLAADLVARAQIGTRQSAELRIALRLPAFLGAFALQAHYPAYLAMDDEALPVGGDTLVLPEGTELRVSGRATIPLAHAAIAGPDGSRSLTVSGPTFSGSFAARSGTWHLAAAAAGGAALGGDLPVFAVRIVPDSAPTVDIPIPGVDTVAPASLRLAVVVAARDDHGVTSAVIEVHRSNSAAITRMPLPLAPGGGDRALVPAVINLAALGLGPGDTLRYDAVATDNAPARHSARSREYQVRIPTEAEQRAARQLATAATVTSFDSVRDAAARVQQDADDLSREQLRNGASGGAGNSGTGAQPNTLPRETVQRAQTTAEAQQKVLDAAAKLQQSVNELAKTAQEHGLADSALARQLAEIGHLLDQALTPELRARLDSLRAALQSLDPDRTRTALQNLAQDEARLKQALDQAAELFKRAALETRLANLAETARDLAADQHRVTPQLAASDSGRSAAQEQSLGARTDSLGDALRQAADQVPARATAEALRGASSQARAAAGDIANAAQAAQQGQSAAAQGAGQQAQARLDPLESEIRTARQQMQQQMRTEVTDGLDRALAETTRLGGRQLATLDGLQSGAALAPARIDQGLIEEGAAKVMEQVIALAGKNALISPSAANALAAARQAMQLAVHDLASATPNLADAVTREGDALDGLNVAAFSLLRARQQVQGSQSGTGLQEALAQMQQLAGKQGQLTQEAGGMLQLGQSPMQRLLQLAAQQRAIAQQLQRLQAMGQLPGAGALADEAKDLAQHLETGDLSSDVVQRQQQLFRHMLDAGRTLQGDETDDTHRQATTARDGPISFPPALDARALQGGAIRLPSWEALQQLSPGDRRRVLDYFQRLAEGGGP